jgi:hypothetical protein
MLNSPASEALPIASSRIVLMFDSSARKPLRSRNGAALLAHARVSNAAATGAALRGMERRSR